MGKEPGQGVGYLDDGTMVVVDNAKKLIGQQVNLEVVSLLQTSSGRIVLRNIMKKTLPILKINQKQVSCETVYFELKYEFYMKPFIYKGKFEEDLRKQ